MQVKSYYRCSLLVALIAGVAFHFAFDPYNWKLLSILCPGILLCLLLLESNTRRAFFIGFIFGLGIFGGCISFIYFSTNIYGEKTWWFASGLSLLFISYLGLYYALLAYVVQRFFPDNSAYKRLLIFPAAWVLAEYTRSYCFTGFPILLLGQSQANSIFAPWLPVIGVYGLSFILVFVAALVLEMILESRRKHGLPLISAGILLSVFAITLSLHYITWTHTEGKPITVTLVQGNINRLIKWSDKHVDDIQKTYLLLTEPHWSSDLIIWPEAAITLPMERSKDLINILRNRTQVHHNTLITGIPFSSPKGNAYYNGMLAIGLIQEHYFKQHLFPFGEYYPFRDWFEWLMEINPSYYLPGSEAQGLLYVGSMRIAPYLCFEIAFNSIVHRNFPKANLIVTLTDDAWFSESLAPWQHFQIVKVQSLQTGRYQLFATNNGITGIINDQGQVESQLPAFKAGTLTGRIYLKTGSTPWVLWGDRPIILLSLFLFLLPLISRLNCRNINNP